MGLLDTLIDKLEGGSSNNNNNGPPQSNYGGGSYGYSQQQQQQQPPPVSYPWVVEWLPQENRWLFINQQTGERTTNYPGGPQQGGYNNYGPSQGQYGGGQYGGYEGQPPQEKSGGGGGGHGMAYGAMGAAAGLAGGMLLAHEGDKLGEHLSLSHTHSLSTMNSA